MKQHIKQTALRLVKESGLINLSRRELCEAAGIPDGSFPHIMGCTFTEFLSELKQTVNNESLKIHPVNKVRTNPELRKEHILNAALSLAVEQGYDKMTRDAIAERAGVSMGLVTRYFETMNQLRQAVMRAAISRGIHAVIAQGIVNHDKQVKKIPEKLRKETLKHIAGV